MKERRTKRFFLTYTSYLQQSGMIAHQVKPGLVIIVTPKTQDRIKPEEPRNAFFRGSN